MSHLSGIRNRKLHIMQEGQIHLLIEKYTDISQCLDHYLLTR